MARSFSGQGVLVLNPQPPPRMRGSTNFMLLLLSLLFTLTLAANVTVDDANPLWKYSSAPDSTGWGVIDPRHECSFCLELEQPDPTKVYNHIWHDTDQSNSTSLVFTGVALTVYVICPGPLDDGSVYVTNYTFTLDGAAAGTHSGPGCAALTYNYPIFTKSGLSPGSHNFTIANAPSPASSLIPRSDLLLDYAVYDDGGLTSSTSIAPAASRPASVSSSSTSTSTPSSSSQRPQSGLPGTTALIGIVICSLIGLVAGGGVVL
jgi:hypothetical protein